MMSSWLISVFVTACCSFGLMCYSLDVLHWFLIPVFASGVVVGVDAIDWMRGRLEPFDPAGVVGLLGFHVFFLCPLLVGGWHHRLRYLPDQPDDYRPWIGGVAALTFLGLLIYRYVLRTSTATPGTRPSVEASYWRICPKHFWFLLAAALLISGALQVWAYYTLGGISGYIAEYSNWLKGQEAFRGTTALFSVSESFPILVIFGFAVWSRGAGWRRSWLVLGAVLLGFVVLLLLFGGLRGGRSNTVWGLFWAVGVLHLWVRPVPRTMVLCGLPLLVAFMSIYAVYKVKGADTLAFVSNSTSYEEIESGSETTAEVLLGDLGRSDVQAFLLYRLLGSDVPYRYAIGQTYLGAVAMIIPKEIWPSRPPTKIKWTTEAEYGQGSYENGVMMSSRVYGLIGEAMLNFGPLFVPVPFIALGLAVARLRKMMNGLLPDDSRLLLMPFLVNFCILLLINDSDNQVFYLFKYGLIPFLLILLASEKVQDIFRVRRPSYAHEFSRY